MISFYLIKNSMVKRSIFFILFIQLHTIHCLKLPLSPVEAQTIGQRIWQNECAQRIDGLTCWNIGEQWASVGIGHFIWYPPNTHNSFKQTFPSLLYFMKKNGVKLPSWLDQARLKGCPWKNREHFLQEFNSPRMIELRSFLVSTIDHQTAFMLHRLENTLPALLQTTQKNNQKKHIEQQFLRMLRTKGGIYALVDYVNFKGEGIKPNESYNGIGWGLLQVLERMQGTTKDHDTLLQFTQKAQETLQIRVANAPVQRNEARWLPGWINRLKTYLQNNN